MFTELIILEEIDGRRSKENAAPRDFDTYVKFAEILRNAAYRLQIAMMIVNLRYERIPDEGECKLVLNIKESKWRSWYYATVGKNMQKMIKLLPVVFTSCRNWKFCCNLIYVQIRVCNNGRSCNCKL